MKTKGDARHVFRCLHENQRARDLGQELPHSIVGVGLGGGMECIRVAATCAVLQEYGLAHAFSTLVAISGSGGPFGSLLSDNAHRLVMLFQHLAVSGFIKWDPSIYAYRMDMKLYEDVLTGERAMFGLNQKMIEQSPVDFWVMATRPDGTPRVINVKTMRPHAARAICASCAVPISSAPIVVDGEDLHDGAFSGNPMPIELSISLLKSLKEGERPKVLVMQSRIHPKYRQTEWWMWPSWVRLMYGRALSPALCENMARVDSCFASAAERLALMREVDWCRLAPTPLDTSILPTTISLPLLRHVYDEVRYFVRNLVVDTLPARQI